MLIPAARHSSIAGRHSVVPGILIIALGRPSFCQRTLASWIVAAASCASRGETSRLTKPSPPAAASSVVVPRPPPFLRTARPGWPPPGWGGEPPGRFWYLGAIARLDHPDPSRDTR